MHPPAFVSASAPAPGRNGEVHKHQLDSEGRWLRLAEYTPPASGEWDNPFLLRVDQKVPWGGMCVCVWGGGGGGVEGG